jgi:uncharacterized protein (TIGR02147 family)
MSQYVNIFEFTKVRNFLAEYQERRALSEPTFTRTEFCNKLGLPHTRSYFNDVLKGKAITKEMLSRFVAVIGLKGDEARYFEAMVHFDQGKTADARELAMKRMLKLNPNPQIIVEPESYELFSNWYNVVVFNALDAMNVADDVTELQQKLFPPVSEKKIRESLALLKKMDLIRKNDKGFWKATRESYRTVSECKDKMVLQYQMKCLDLSRQALESADGESRDFTTFNFSVSRRGREKIEHATERFKEEVRKIVREDRAAATEVEHINLHVFSNVKNEKEGE